MWSQVTKILPRHAFFFLKSTTSKSKKLFPMFSLSVCCYFSGWKASLSHALGCFLVASMMRQSANASWLWVWVNMLEKSLKSVKNKTKSMSVSLSVSLPPLLPHICPLFFFFFLTPPQFWETRRNDSPQDGGWTGYEGPWGGSRSSRVSRVRHALRCLGVKSTSVPHSVLYERGQSNPCIGISGYVICSDLLKRKS